MTYTELEAEIKKLKEWIDSAEESLIFCEKTDNLNSVEVHCMLDELSAMEETLEEMLREE